MQLDYEGEMVVVIGKGGRHIAKSRALEHVAGYSIFNDASIRDFQTKSPQWTVGKNFDGTGAFGPDLVTADELPPGVKGLRLETRLNGEVVQSASTDEMVFDVESLISIISEAITLEAGDVIPDYGGRNATFQIAQITPPDALVYQSRRGHTSLTWSLSLEPVSSEPSQTRVFLRLRMAPVRHKLLARTAGELIDLLTIAGMAAGLAERLRGQDADPRPA